MSQPRAEWQLQEATRVAVLYGRWTATALARGFGSASFPPPNMGSTNGLQPAACAWDLRQVDRLDHTGAQWLWNHWGHQWPADLRAQPAQHTLLERVAQFGGPAPKPARRSVQYAWHHLGAAVLDVAAHVLGFIRLIGQLALDGVRLLRNPQRGPWRDFSGHLYRIGATALPITALVGGLIGVVLAYLVAQQLQLFGAGPYIVNLLGIAVIRELGPMLAALLVAGRSGSTITAQIGVMRVTEELDAMRVMGIPQSFRLVLPRVLALAFAMPLLSVWTTAAALLGGMAASDVALGVSPAYFVRALPDAVQAANLGLATAKSCAFGVLIALVGCHFGLRVQPDTESLGEGTTASVVVSITGVILVDALFAIVFKDVGI
jgi:phospholipid/cholesterol/gamma-HCH transport system permease protein